MASKEEQAVKNLNMENTLQEREGGDQAPLQNGEELRDLGGGRGQKPGGNVRLGRIRRLVPNFRWAIPSRHIDHNEVGDDAEKHVGQMMEIRRKTKKQQMRPHLRYQTPEPDNHYEFCLISSILRLSLRYSVNMQII
ncbi:protein BEX4-like [Monodon monoceros]|uniref:protein BEX4-like n=1 Tax=Monodon monoceros TaxID=40151 RepID=UPI0010F91E71|nr:protein BEX4-like [Monodon monoceros]